jgi:predicted patatin/cPLA2 family phospholipase
MESQDYHEFFDDCPEVLSFGGGSYKTACFVGALYYLDYQKKIDLSKVEVLQGASAGSLIALSLNLGMKPNAIMYYLLKTNIMNEFRKDVHTKFVERIVFEGTFKGLTQGNSLMKKLSNIFKENFSDWHDAITFEELFNITKQKLFITATNISQRKLIHFNHENYPKLPVLLAIRMSIGIPLVFESYKFQNELYVDGDLFGFPLRKDLKISPEKKVLRLKNEKGEEVALQQTQNADSILKKLMHYYSNEKLLNKEIDDINGDKKLKIFFIECNLKSALRFDQKFLSELYLSGMYQTKNFNKKRNEELFLSSNFA